MSERPHIVLRIGLFVLGLAVMYFGLFTETATSATNEYRLAMTVGLIFTILADAILYLVYANGGFPSKGLPVPVSPPGPVVVAYDWLARGPSVFFE